MEEVADAEVVALAGLVRLLEALPDDESRRRVIAYGSDRCIKKPAPGFNYALAQQLAQHGQQR